MNDSFVYVNDLFEKNKEELPEFVNHTNIVYCCENIVNHKKYVGQTNCSLYDRWTNLFMGHKISYINKLDTPMIHSFYKYGLHNFVVTILEENFQSKDDRLLAEKKWIKELNTYVHFDNSNGYNLSTGGEDGSQLNTVESHRKSLETNRKNHGGILAYNLPDAHKKSLESNRKNHGGVLYWNTKEVRDKANETNRKNHGGVLSCSTKESLEKGRQTQYEKYGCLYIHLPHIIEKALESNKINHGGVLSFNTPEAIEKMKIYAPLGRLVAHINRNINLLIDNNLEVNAFNYINYTDNKKRMWQQHIPNVLNKLQLLRTLDKWTEDMENIFSHISIDDSKKGFNKLIII